MKKIKVNYIDTSKPIINGIIQDEKMKYIHNRLKKYYDVEITDIDPQFVFGDIYGCEFIKYDCIRIGCTVEEYTPEFNVYDYVISIFDEFKFKDRIFCLKILLYLDLSRKSMEFAQKRERFSVEDLKKKTDFCSFVQSKSMGADSARLEFFQKLSEYKKVNSGGRVFNNVGGRVSDKLEFERKHKFSISFINGRNYTLQDRPLDAFAAGTLPIYWGNPDIGKVYNTKAFVNCMDYKNFDEVVERIKEIDNNDDLYIKMMNEPIFVGNVSLEEEEKKFDDFLINIIENGSVQRSKAYWNRIFEREVYTGRKKFTRMIRLANKTRPITSILFASKAGQKLKTAILGIYESRIMFRKAYKDIR